MPGVTMTTGEVAQLFGISEPAVRKLAERGVLGPVQAGARPLTFHEQDVWDLQRRRRSSAERAEIDALWAEVDQEVASGSAGCHDPAQTGVSRRGSNRGNCPG